VGAAEAPAVRDQVLNETLRRLATEAATRFTTLVAGGDEIPFDVAEDTGEGTLFYRYVPLTKRYVVDRSDEVRALPSFGPACSAVAAADVAAAYLEARGLPVPADRDQRAAGMLVAFIAELWDGSAEFSVESTRLERALAELDAETRDLEAADVLITPIIGLQLPVPALELPSGVRIVRADAIEAPLEAMSSEGMERSAWEPQFLALAEQGEGHEGATAGLGQLRDLISVLRLFKEGGVALGPYAFAATGEGKWRRIATGAPPPRRGGYKLSEAEASAITDFAKRLEARPDPEPALAWAVRRFELGCERPTALDGLSDHLLALRAVLEGEGVVGAALPVRAAALIAEAGDREEVRAKLDRAFSLEASLMGGEPPADAGAALGLAIWIEECARSVLRDAALGDLGEDLGAVADDSLIASGLQAGDGSGGQADEWDMLIADEIEGLGEPEHGSEVTRLLEPIPQDTSEIRVTRFGGASREAEAAESEEDFEAGSTATDATEEEHGGGSENQGTDWGVHVDDDEESEMKDRDWLSEVSRDERATLEWPAAKERPRLPRREREPIDTPRVRHLFQVPEDADWEVRELEYDRRKAGIGR
jgi:hypothetical protein